MVSLAASCGGGGGGGGDNNANSGGNGNNVDSGSSSSPTSATGGGLTLSADHSSLSLDFKEGQLNVGQVIWLKATGTPTTSSVYVIVDTDRPDLMTPDAHLAGIATGYVTVTPKALSAGSYAAHLNVSLCGDAACQTRLLSMSFPVSMHIRTGIVVSETSLALHAFAGMTSSHALTLTLPAAPVMVDATVTDNEGRPIDWLSTRSVDTTHFEVLANATRLAPGTYSAKITFRDTEVNSWLERTVPVTLTVGEGLIAPAPLQLDLSAGTPPSALTGSIPVTAATPVATWTAKSSQPWLKLSVPGTPLPAAITYSIDAALVAQLPNETDAVCMVTLSSAGLSDVAFTVTLHKHLPVITAVTPTPVVAGVASTAIISGRGFLGFGRVDVLTAVNAPGLTPSAATVISDQQIRLSLPALAAGRYAIGLNTLSGVSLTGGGSLTVAASPDYTATTTPALGVSPRSLIYDATRNAIFATDRSHNALVRFQYVGGNWVSSQLAIPAVGEVDITPDASMLVVTVNDNKLVLVDPDKLSVLETLEAYYLAAPPNDTHGIAISADGRAWIGRTEDGQLLYFDLATRKVQYFTSANGVWAGVTGWPSVSQDRTRVMFSADRTRSGPRPTRRFDVESNLLQITTQDSSWGYSMSKDGSRFITENANVYELNEHLIGTLNPSDPTLFGSIAVISNDGRRVYRLMSTLARGMMAEIDVFDVDAVNPSTGDLVKIGVIPLSIGPANCLQVSPGTCDGGGRMMITPNGHTLFLLNSNMLAVIPIPPALQAPISAPQVRFMVRH